MITEFITIKITDDILYPIPFKNKFPIIEDKNSKLKSGIFLKHRFSN